MLFPILGPNSLPIEVTQPDERHANKTTSVLKWYDISIIASGSNEEEGILVDSERVCAFGQMQREESIHNAE